jgi:hypothetical protein
MIPLPIVFDLLQHTIVGNGMRAQRHAPMTRSGTAKYYAVDEPISDDQTPRTSQARRRSPLP